MKLELATLDEGKTRTIVVKGDVDMDSSPELRDELRHALRGAEVLRIDLGGVGYIDSSGIAVLITGYRLAREQRARFCLLAASPQVKAVIELSRLQDFFPTCT